MTAVAESLYVYQTPSSLSANLNVDGLPLEYDRETTNYIFKFKPAINYQNILHLKHFQIERGSLDLDGVETRSRSLYGVTFLAKMHNIAGVAVPQAGKTYDWDDAAEFLGQESFKDNQNKKVVVYVHKTVDNSNKTLQDDDLNDLPRTVFSVDLKRNDNVIIHDASQTNFTWVIERKDGKIATEERDAFKDDGVKIESLEFNDP